MLTAPVAGKPYSSITVTAAEASVWPGRPDVLTFSVVSVAVFWASADAGTRMPANAKAAAQNQSSRTQRQLLFLCTCSKPSKMGIVVLLCVDFHCIRHGCFAANP
jgi:hypothetical protein